MTSKAYDALTAEAEAAEAEGLYAPTPEEMKMLKRFKELRTRSEAIAAEMDAIKSKIIANMEEKSARALVVNGKNWVLISDSSKKVVNLDAVEEAFPGLIKAYEEAVEQFTTRITLPRHTKAVKPA